MGLDPRWESLPRSIVSGHSGDNTGRAKGYQEFCCRVLDLVAPYCAVIKPQSAFFEALGAAGHVALKHTIEKAHSLGLLVILDAKRNDIASTATAYAQAAFQELDADALTINPYLGRDAVEPFLEEASQGKRGLYVLVRTSNPGAGLFQDLKTEQGKLYAVVGKEVASWNARDLGGTGFGNVGAVVGATSPGELAELRQLMPQVPFLIPGYGAQGGTAQDCRAAFLAGGLGAVVNSARGILFPYQPEDSKWEEKIKQAAQRAARELGQVAGL